MKDPLGDLEGSGLDRRAGRGPGPRRLGQPELGKQSFKAYAEAWRARQVRAESTRTTFEIALNAHIYPKIGDWRIDSIRQADVQELVAKWSATAAPTTVHLRYGVLAIVMKAAAKERVRCRLTL